MKTSTNNWFRSLKSGTIVWFGTNSIAIILKTLQSYPGELKVYDKTILNCDCLVLKTDGFITTTTLYEDINKEIK